MLILESHMQRSERFGQQIWFRGKWLIDINHMRVSCCGNGPFVTMLPILNTFNREAKK